MVMKGLSIVLEHGFGTPPETQKRSGSLQSSIDSPKFSFQSKSHDQKTIMLRKIDGRFGN
jgi:hypothetical protein